MEVIILGCGGSLGVPVLGCTCPVCKAPTKEKNIRTRSSILIKTKNINILVDSGPDFRTQILKSGYININNALYTHAHSDHILGISDLRFTSFVSKEPITLYGSKETMDEVYMRFSFVFDQFKDSTPRPDFLFTKQKVILPNIKFTIGDVNITPFQQEHGTINSYGYFFESNNKKFAYSTDFSFINKENLHMLKNANLSLWILECLRYSKSLSHSIFDNSVKLAKIVNAKQTLFTHMSHDIDYYNMPMINNNIMPAYDGLVIAL